MKTEKEKRKGMTWERQEIQSEKISKQTVILKKQNGARIEKYDYYI